VRRGKGVGTVTDVFFLIRESSQKRKGRRNWNSTKCDGRGGMYVEGEPSVTLRGVVHLKNCHDCTVHSCI
jgi:hypothetical protein